MTDHDLRAAGAVALLELLDAAMAWGAGKAGLSAMFDPEASRLMDVVDRLEILLAELKPEPAHEWRPGTWGQIEPWGAGTRVRLGGVEATVAAIGSSGWHVDPNSPARNPRPLEHQFILVDLVERPGTTYRFPPGNPVEYLDVNWPTTTDADWAAAALAAQEERALRVLAEAFGARRAKS